LAIARWKGRLCKLKARIEAGLSEVHKQIEYYEEKRRICILTNPEYFA
jgi:hypothetical protein